VLFPAVLRPGAAMITAFLARSHLRPPPPVTPAPPSGLVVAHRAGLGHAPENSLDAIRAAADHGADAVELDVRLAEGSLICAHDPGQAGPRALDAVELALRLGLRVELDLKSHGLDGAIGHVAGLVGAIGAYELTWVSTFHPVTVWRLRHAEPRLVVGWSVARSMVARLPLWQRWCDWLGVQVIEPEFPLITPHRLDRWRARPIAVEAWGLAPHEARDCLARGVSVVVDRLTDVR
jgi:hypothetical protein